MNHATAAASAAWAIGDQADRIRANAALTASPTRL